MVCNFLRTVILVFVVVFLFSCEAKRGENIKNTYYVEFVNGKDSLLKYLRDQTNGKAVYMKYGKREVVSFNYKTNDYSGMHYFKIMSELGSDVPEGTRKIRVEIKGDYTVDSAQYSLQKFRYVEKKWVKYSDMGFIIATTSSSEKVFSIPELGSQIIINIFDYTFQ